MAYGGMTPNTYGTAPTVASARDRITQALMRVANPPPGNMLQGQSPAMPSDMGPSVQQATAQQPPLANAGVPQVQQAGLGAAGPAMGAMGPLGGAMQPGLNLPGVTPPGQLPQGMGVQRPY